MGSLFSSAKNREDIDMALAKAKQIVSSNPVVVFRSFLVFLSEPFSHFLLLISS